MGIGKIAQNILATLGDRPSCQSLFEKLQTAGLAGMNIGGGAQLEKSGELYLMALLSRVFRTEDPVVLFDVGANKGAYTEALAKTFGSHFKTRIYSFEPSPSLYAETRKRFEALPKAEQILFFSVGVSDQAGKMTLYGSSKASWTGINSLYARRLEHFGVTLDFKEEVELTTLDTFCCTHQIPRIHFLKLDIEGHELAALRGAKELLSAGAIDVIQFEFGGCNIDSRTFFQDFYYLLKDHYQICRLLRKGLFPLTHYRERYEVFETTNFVALRRPLDENILRR